LAGWRTRLPRGWPLHLITKAHDRHRFLDAIDAVDHLGVSAAAAEAIAPLRQDSDSVTRMFAVVGLTVLGPRDQDHLRDLIALFEDRTEAIEVRRAAAPCIGLFGKGAGEAIQTLRKAATDEDDLSSYALMALSLLDQHVSDLANPSLRWTYMKLPSCNPTMRELAEFAIEEAQMGLTIQL
jgi:hypothetical protein